MHLKSEHLESLWITDILDEVQTGDELGLKASISCILLAVLEMTGPRSLFFFCRQMLAVSVLVSGTEWLSIMIGVKDKWKSHTSG